MLCAVYKSSKKSDTFLYVEKRDDFSKVPKPLMETFGIPIFVIIINTDKKKTVAGLATSRFYQKFKEHQFYLQLPPREEDMMEAHRLANGLDKQPDVKF